MSGWLHPLGSPWTRFVTRARARKPLVVVLLVSAAVAAAGAPAGAAAAPAASGRLLVGFKKGVSRDAQQRLLAAFDGRVARRFESVRGGRLVVVKPRSGRA